MKLLIVSRSQRSQNELRHMALAHGAHDVFCHFGGVEILAALVEQHLPDALLLDCEQEPDDFSALSALGLHYPRMAILLSCFSHAPEFLLGAMRAGVREVLPQPAPEEALQQALARVEEKLKLEQRATAEGKVLAFIPCKGGSGATFLAANLAYYLAAQEQKRVLLLDLNLQFGDAALFVSERAPAVCLAEVARQIHRLDAAFLASSVMNILPNFGVLAAPEDPAQGAEVMPGHVETLVQLARKHYDIVVLDVGRTLGPVSIKALDLADVVFPVLQITLPFIRDARRLMAVMRTLGYPSGKVRPLVNRYEKGGDIQLIDVERTLGVAVYKTLPNSFRAVAASVNQGVPIGRLAPNNPVSRTLLELGRLLVAEGGDSGGSSWWGSLLGRLQGASAEGGALNRAAAEASRTR